MKIITLLCSSLFHRIFFYDKTLDAKCSELHCPYSVRTYVEFCEKRAILMLKVYEPCSCVQR